MIRFTADTNIYVSALNFHGVPEEVLNLAHAAKVELAVSNAILFELSRILRHKFTWTELRIHEAETDILSYATLVTPSRQVDAVPDDPTDNRILECAVEARSQYVVTGDRHLLKLEAFNGIRILTPATFLQICSETGK